MAWRIDEYVIRGEIDNRTRGLVTGEIWLVGQSEPVKLCLQGNAWRDLAGRKLQFVNPTPKAGLPGNFAAEQTGQTGDITASRKVRVPEIPIDQIGEYHAAGKAWAWHWGNSLYLEWFSARNGRVVIETCSYELTVSPDVAWEMTAAEDAAQRETNGLALADFMGRIRQAMEQGTGRANSTPSPLTEAEAERLQAESERLMDRVIARLDRDGESADFARIVDEEVTRARRERGEPDLTPEEQAERNEWIEEMNAAAAESMDEEMSEAWKRGQDDSSAEFEARHPLEARAYELAVRVMRETGERGWIPPSTQVEHPLVMLVMGICQGGATLASVQLDNWPPPLEFCAMIIVRLKKSAGNFDDALLAIQSCHEESLTEPGWLDSVSGEITRISADISALIEEQRARLKPGP